MAYTKLHTPWQNANSVTGGGDTSTPINAAAMDYIEAGIAAAAATADAAIPKPGSPSTNQALVWNGSAWVADTVKNANIDAAAAIAYSKLNLAGSLKFADMVAGVGGPPGTEIDYAQITSDLSVAGSSAAQTTVVAGAAKTYTGAEVVLIEFYSGMLTLSASTFFVITLWEDSTELGVIAEYFHSGSASHNTPAYGALRRTPSAGSHTYTVKAWKAGGTFSIAAHAVGTPGERLPAYVRVTRAA